MSVTEEEIKEMREITKKIEALYEGHEDFVVMAALTTVVREKLDRDGISALSFYESLLLGGKR